MAGFVKNAVGKRLEGDRPSVPQAILASGMSGVGAAVVAYKIMRTRS
jgi:hypothetical protein